MTLPIAVYITGDPVPGAKSARGDFFRMITEGVGEYPGGFFRVECEGEPTFSDPRNYSGIIVSGSPAHVTDGEDWVLRTEDALRRAHKANIPILGICFGHQLLGEALGGRVARNPNGREIGTVDLTVRAPDPLLDGVTARPTVVMTHLDSVVETPPRAVVVRSSELDPRAAIRFSDTTWGVQFHPEMDAEIVGHYLEHRRALIESEGIDVARVLRDRVDTAYGRQLFRRFAVFCRSGGESFEGP